MDCVDNNQFEVKPISKRKIIAPRPNVYLNPALDLLANEDKICNTAMEIPMKKRKRTKSCDVATFENSGLDLEGKPVNEVLVREIDNVRSLNTDLKQRVVADLKSNQINQSVTNDLKDAKGNDDSIFKFMDDTVDFTNNVNSSNDKEHATVVNTSNPVSEPMYANLGAVKIPNTIKVPVIVEPTKNKEVCPLPVAKIALQNSMVETKGNLLNCDDISRITPEEVDSGISVLEKSKTAEFSNISNITNIHSNVTNQVVLNNSNLSLSFIDRLALDSPNVSESSLFYDDDLNESNIMEIKTITIITKKKRIVQKKNTNPFLQPNVDTAVEISTNNPFLDMNLGAEGTEEEQNKEIEYQEEVMNRVERLPIPNENVLMPRRLFSDNTNSTISTVNETSIESQHEYENIDIHEDPIYENIDELNKQSKILGCDVSQFSAIDIMNKNRANYSTESNDSKKDKHSFFKAGKLSKKVFKTLKKTFKHDKSDGNTTLNPYEVPRKLPKQKAVAKESGIENPALNLDNSDDLEFEELSDEEHQYETIKTIRNTRLNMNVTPLKEKNEDFNLSNRNTPGKKVRFDSTLNQEKVITGNSFDCSMASPGFDAKIDKYHDELENCINERKFLQQNM